MSESHGHRGPHPHHPAHLHRRGEGSPGLGVEEGDEDYWLSLPDDEPRANVYDIYQWVGYLQETLVDGLSH